MRAIGTALLLLTTAAACGQKSPDASGDGGTAGAPHAGAMSTAGSPGAGGSASPGAGTGGTGGTGGTAGTSGSGGTSSVGGSAGAATVGGSNAGGVGGAAGSAMVGGGAGGVAAGGAGQGGGGAGGGSAGMVGIAGSPNGAHYPFGTVLRSSRCTYPASASSADVKKSYDAWKTELVTANGAGGHLRVQRPNSPNVEANSTVSEGIAYGMLITVFMDDRMVFDELWKYALLWMNSNGLMDWYINAAGTQRLGTGGATDADEDMAWALVMASEQWGGQGSLDKPYLDYAKTLIKAIWDHEIDHTNSDFLLAGDTWGGNIIFNGSYFAPSEYRVFGEVTNDTAGWGRVIDTGYTVLAKSLNAQSGNASNGLVPAWCDVNGAPKVPYDNGPTNYQYDSARIPFRIGLDYCWYGEARAKTYLDKISAFFAGIGASKIVDGYDLNGTPHPDADSDPNGPQSAVFVGSAAVGAMHDTSFQSFVDDAYALDATGQLLARSRYYNLSWTTLTLAMLNGNLAEYPRQ